MHPRDLGGNGLHQVTQILKGCTVIWPICACGKLEHDGQIFQLWQGSLGLHDAKHFTRTGHLS